MATAVTANAHSFTHDNFTASTTNSARTLPAKTNYILVENLDASIAIKVSIDSGTTFKTVGAGKTLSIEGLSIGYLGIKSASGTPSVECLYGFEA